MPAASSPIEWSSYLQMQCSEAVVVLRLQDSLGKLRYPELEMAMTNAVDRSRAANPAHAQFGVSCVTTFDRVLSCYLCNLSCSHIPPCNVTRSFYDLQLQLCVFLRCMVS